MCTGVLLGACVRTDGLEVEVFLVTVVISRSATLREIDIALSSCAPANQRGTRLISVPIFVGVFGRFTMERASVCIKLQKIVQDQGKES